MRFSKGCFNKDCVSYQERRKYPSNYRYCPICSNELNYVCSDRKCYNLLAEQPNDPLCKDCRKRRDERKQKMIEDGKRIPAILGSVVAVVHKADRVRKEVTKYKRG